MREGPDGACPHVGRLVRVHTKAGDIISGRVAVTGPERFAVINPSGMFWVRASGWDRLDHLDHPSHRS